MMKRSVLSAVVGALVALVGMPAAAHSRSPWQMHHGLEVTPSNPLGLIQFSCTPVLHGDSCEYSGVTIPPEGHEGWSAAPDEDAIGLEADSRVCQAPSTCSVYGDFTYFQSFVNVPASTLVTEFKVTFSRVDDGARVTIFNSQHPSGITVPESFVYLGLGLSTGNLAEYMKAGELNRVVVTLVDDCCARSYLTGVALHLNTEVVELACEGPADCDDGNACTADVCTSNGTCSNPLLACANGQSCAPNPNLSGAGEVSAMTCTPNSSGQPTLVAHGDLDMTLECGEDVWVDPGAQAWDATCAPLTVHKYNSGSDAYGPGPNTCAEGTYSVQYLAWDAAGKTVGAIRWVKVDDTTPPLFTLKGATHIVHTCGAGFVDPGWEAWDACYGNVTPEVKVFGYANGWAEGTYTLTYTLTDSGGNSAPSLTRTVEVVNCPW